MKALNGPQLNVHGVVISTSRETKSSWEGEKTEDDSAGWVE